MERKKNKPYFALLCITATIALTLNASSADPPTIPRTFTDTMKDVQNILLQVGSALGILMISMEGIKWLSSQSPQERESARKGVIYIMIGLLLLRSSESIIRYLLGQI